jgi:hypothetical protein
LEFSFSGGTVILEGEPEVLNWYRPICQDLFNLLSLRPNWDSYGAYAIEIESVVNALNMLEKIADLNTPKPSVVPTVLGGIQLEWHTKGIDLEIEIDPAGKGSVFYQNKFGKMIEKEGNPTNELDLLIELIAELSN